MRGTRLRVGRRALRDARVGPRRDLALVYYWLSGGTDGIRPIPRVRLLPPQEELFDRRRAVLATPPRAGGLVRLVRLVRPAGERIAFEQRVEARLEAFIR